MFQNSVQMKDKRKYSRDDPNFNECLPEKKKYSKLTKQHPSKTY